MNFNSKRVLIMGLGVQGGGVGVARFFAKKGAFVTVSDLKTEAALAESVKVLKSVKGKPIRFVLGKHREEDFKNTDLVIRNPDVPQNSHYLRIARDNKIPVEMDEGLFIKLCPALRNIIGITGTRGKTTTTHLIGAILKKAGYHTLLGGNLRGIATLSLLDQITPQTKVVLELSSWQLQGLNWNKVAPHIAVITNIFPDHLNRYRNMTDYINDKKSIYKFQGKNDLLILNHLHKLDQYYTDFAKETKSKIVWFSPDDIPWKIINKFHLKGSHNLENLAAAFQVAKILNIDDDIIEETAAEFKGVEFRLQEIAKINGVTYVNDTTSTIPEATINALKVYAGQPIILLCGGPSKNLGVRELAKEINHRVKNIVLLEGQGTDELISDSFWQISKDKIIGPLRNFKEAVLIAKNKAKKGDVILLSPAFASFGMFKNEFDRGEQFNAIIQTFKKTTK